MDYGYPYRDKTLIKPRVFRAAVIHTLPTAYPQAYKTPGYKLTHSLDAFELPDEKPIYKYDNVTFALPQSGL
jgi:hypothetical protein